MSEVKMVKVMGSNGIRLIPNDELAPGMCEVTIENDDGTEEKNVWIDSRSVLPASKIRHTEPFSDEFMRNLRKLKADLSVVLPRSIEDWENCFRSERNPEKELKIWLKVAAYYNMWIVSHPTHSLGKKKETFNIMMECTMTSADSILNVVDLHFMSKADAKDIIVAFGRWLIRHKDDL